MKKLSIGLLLVYLLFLTGCSGTKSNIIHEKEDPAKKLDRLLRDLHNPHLPDDDKKYVIQQMGYLGDRSVIPELNKILEDNTKVELWMTTAESLETLGVKNAVLAQKEYEKIREFEKDYYYVKGLKGNNVSAIEDPQQFNKIIIKSEEWIKRFPKHPKVQSVEISIRYFKERTEKITLEKVYAHPDKYLSKTIEWQGVIKEIIMENDQVKLTLLSGLNIWY